MIFFISYDNGSRIPGCRLAPYYIYTIFKKIDSNFQNKDFLNLNLYNENSYEAEKYITGLIKNTVINLSELNLIFGGDHSITYFVIKGLVEKKFLELSTYLIIFDAHFDGFLKKEEKIKNWNFINDITYYFKKIIIIGFRDYVNMPIKHKNNIVIIDSNDINKDFIKFKKELINLFINKKVYISIDMDCIDPTDFPGVSYPIEGGLSIKQLQECLNILYNISQISIIDIVEFNPMIELYNIYQNYSTITRRYLCIRIK